MLTKRFSSSTVRSICAAAAVAITGFSVASPSLADTKVLQATSIFGETDFSSVVLRRWAELVLERTEGRYEFRYHWAGSLVGNQTLDGMSDGIVDVAVQFTPYVSGDIIDLGVLDIPFSFPLDAEGLAAFHREVRPFVTEIYKNYGSQVVSATPIILANPLTCSDRFLSDEGKWSGVIVRAAGRWHSETIRAWGGSPVVISPGELYSALDRGTADCTLMVYNGVNSMKLYEVAPKITRVDHSVAFGTINVSDAAWEQIPEEDRKIMLEVGDEIVTWAAEETNRRLEGVIDEMAAGGAEYCTPTSQEFERLVAATDGVIDSIRDQVSDNGAAIIEVVDRYRSSVITQPAVGPNNACP